ncbi:hypothetical protein RKD26_000797 [Streptomyces calvus]
MAAALRDGRVAVGGVLDAVQGGVLVAAEPGETVVEDVERAVGAEGHVHHLGAAPGHVVDGLDGAVGVAGDPLDPAAAELTGEEVAVVRLGELDGRVERGVVVVDRAAHRGLGAAAELGDGAAVVGDPCGLGRGQVGQAGVVRRGVLRGGAVEGLAGGPGGEVVVDVGVVVAGAVRPAEVAGAGDAGELDLSGGSAGGVGGAGVGTVVTDVEDAGLLVDAEPERVAEAHGVDLGPRPVRAGREEVALRDGVRAVVVDLDAQDLAAQVVGVAGGALGVESRVAVRPLVDGRVAVGLERVGVVAGRQVQVAGRVEVDVTADVAAQATGGGDVEDLLLAGGVEGAVGVEHEPREAVDAVEGREVGGGAGLGRVTGGGVHRGRVVQVDETVLCESGVDADALQALLVVAVHVELAGQPGVAGGVGQAQFAVA